MRSLFQNEQFRAMLQQTRELEAKWPKATDDEKAAIMAQMEGIRAKGMAMVRAEAALAARHAPQPFDRAAARAELDALIGRAKVGA